MTPTDDNSSQAPLRRREALVLLGGAGVGAAWWGSAATAALARSQAPVLASSAARCMALTPEVTPGPYYIVNHLTRRDITDRQSGLALRLRLRVQDYRTCAPISGADVELWHANALGVYSGYGSGGSPGPGARPGGRSVTPDNSRRFLRGHQRSNVAGLVVFDTIYPGWYSGRAPHIHLKVHVGGAVVHTGQLFFDDALSDAVYRSARYAAHGQPDTTDAADSIYRQAGGSRAQLAITRRPGGGYAGAIRIAVRR